MDAVCVFCGARPGGRPLYAEAARRAGAVIARRGLTLVYGGGSVGLMGAVADGALGAGGEVIGVIPEALVDREHAHPDVADTRVVATMHDRKALMAELSDAFVALPGGFGTLEELFEVVTWAQLGIHEKPFGILEVDGYFAPLVAFLDHAVDEGFIGRAQRGLVESASDVEELLDRLDRARPTPVRRADRPPPVA